MRSVYPNLDAEIQSRHMTYAGLAQMIGVSKYAMYRRINGKTDFKLSEVANICQILDRWDASQLFFTIKY